ncbi:hypothetical protein QQF64_030280 [Cirrhinus molitorella]|uniref:Uncharacterized protein n=1 Tax=Cirrhinus molitorella TaxID=172907 RepID=A0ABR3N2Z2_9TELE
MTTLKATDIQTHLTRLPAEDRLQTHTHSHTWQMKTLLASKHKCCTHLSDMRRQRFSQLGGTSVNFSSLDLGPVHGSQGLCCM